MIFFKSKNDRVTLRSYPFWIYKHIYILPYIEYNEGVIGIGWLNIALKIKTKNDRV